MIDVPALVGAAMSDMLSYFQIGGASVSGAAVQGAIASYLRRRLEENRDVLLEELRQARINQIAFASEDEMGGILFRYFNAFRDNTARFNMRLMAKTMVGQAQRGQLYADPFNRYASALAVLNRDEVMVVAELLRNWRRHQFVGENVDERKVMEDVYQNLVPEHFPKREQVGATLASASKSGFLLRVDRAFGFSGFVPSPLLEEVAELVDFQDALRKESRDSKADTGPKESR